MEYYANFRVNNGTCYMRPITGTNKKELRNRIRDHAEAERFAGNEGTFSVWHEDKDGDRIYDYFGYIFSNGRIFYDKARVGQVVM